ncbi:anaerobic nitric oxide reductase transcription regulator [Sinobacterium caligoides]|uniref:Anaerobic nitric oxide reductase transcription regulator n=2 Tax=Sinobacterium caligoides TaxID=933926 RepID=A0A3N2DDV5_9GAMM|nr:anaerobic nitric oxide reductase transcription regulator [Sinobacterium caligoides]
MISDHYIDIVEDLAHPLSGAERYERLLTAIRQSIPCDAIALLQLHDDYLRPVAFFGLNPETAGRRFVLSQHPRLAHILTSRSIVRFESDSDMPDPYDGLVQTVDGELHVHDCMGVSIYIDEQPWGVITLDAMRPGQFDDVPPQAQLSAITLTRAVITVAQHIQKLEQRLVHGSEVTAGLSRDVVKNEIIGSSTAMKQLLEEIDTVAKTPLTVLIQGETGVGKEIIAQHLHLRSDRAEQAMVQINCAALPETLAEAELFGHTKGAFTGATEARSGRFELADGGTLLLDEVGEIPLALQAKLLRALQEGEIQRVGSDDIIKVDVRILAATNRDLKAEVKAGRFRADLYHRLSVFPITIPTLQQRGNDVLLLAENFLERDQFRLNIKKLILSHEAKQALLNYDWPGNVRELEHLLSRAALKAKIHQHDSDIIHIDTDNLGLDHALPTAITTVDEKVKQTPKGLSLKLSIDGFQRQLIIEALAKNHGNVSAAARQLSVHRSNLLRLMKRLGIHQAEPKTTVYRA